MCGSLFRCCLLYILKLLPWEHVSTVRRLCVHVCARALVSLLIQKMDGPCFSLVSYSFTGASKGDGCSEASRTFCSTAIVNVPDCVLNCIIITVTVIISHRGFNDFFFFSDAYCLYFCCATVWLGIRGEGGVNYVRRVHIYFVPNMCSSSSRLPHQKEEGRADGDP